MKVIVTGSTGMVGKGVLLECLDDPRITEVLAVNRNTLGIEHSKLKEVLHKDFSNFSSLENQFNGFDACFHCMGVSSAGMSEEQYTKFTYDFSMALAHACYNANSQMIFNYVSGTGTDSTEKGKSMWARVKGKTENDIIKMGFKKALMFRPGAIQPLRGIKSKTPLYQFFLVIFKPIWPILKLLFGKNITDTTRIGKAMINSIYKEFDKVHLENPQINSLATKEG
ncbi:MAG: NAD-dependent epimerase/dehydratase family protein [Bacteroidia bacterium]